MFDLFLQAAWKVLLAGLVLGAGLPALFALGVRFASPTVATAGGSGGEPTVVPANPGLKLAGLVCFVVVAVAVAVGITVIVAAGFGKVVSFEHVYPTLVPKP